MGTKKKIHGPMYEANIKRWSKEIKSKNFCYIAKLEERKLYRDQHEESNICMYMSLALIKMVHLKIWILRKEKSLTKVGSSAFSRFVHILFEIGFILPIIPYLMSN